MPDMNICARLEAGVAAAAAAETESLARKLAEALPADCVLALEGGLGAGKTTFVKGLAKAWGVAGPVTSPTYNVFVPHRGKLRNLLHLDAFRLRGARETEALMIEDFLESPYCLAVEWPENTGAWLPGGSWKINLEILKSGGRKLRLTRPD